MLMSGRIGLFLVASVLSAAAFAACGNGTGSNFQGGSQDGGVTDGTTSDGLTLNHDGTGGGDSHEGTLTISPATATIKVTQLSTLPTQGYSATFTTNGGAPKKVTPVWSLADYTIGSIDSGGIFSPKGNIGGVVTIQGSYEGLVGVATLNVLVDLESSLQNVTLPDGTTISQGAGGISPGNAVALGEGPDGGVVDASAPSAEPGPSSGWSTLVYPYDQTVFPQGLLAPVIQWTAGSITPQDFKISLATTDFNWVGFGHIGNVADLQAAIPQLVWDGALSSAQPDPKTKEATVTLSLVLASASVAYGPYQAHLIIAPGSLTGVIYFESYGSDAVPDGGTDFGLWSVQPGSTSAPTHLQTGCVICHGVAAAGNTLTTGTDDPTIGYATGVFRIEGDGGYTHLATAPPNLPCTGGSGVPGNDSRGIGWGSVSPDGKVVLRGLGQFWGGEQLLAWAVPDSPLLFADGGLAPLTTTMTVNNGFNMFVPSWSVDEKHLVYVNATNPTDSGISGAPSQSVGVLDVAATVNDGGVSKAGVYGTVTLSKPQTIYDSTATGSTPANAYTKVPAFLPDSQTIVLEETLDGPAGDAPYAYMLPDDGAGIYLDGTLYALQPDGKGGYAHTKLANANASYDPNGDNHNYEAHPLPVQVGGYYWIVFASLRDDAYPQLVSGGELVKKLWVAAITPGTAAGTDPSHPPFTLVNQSIVAAQPTQRGYWVLAPCKNDGTSCTTGSDCCNGSCLPSSSTDPSSPLVCRAPTSCSNLGGRCKAGDNADCCNAASGVQCIGTLNGYGTCGVPAPH
jgi:hypothetical protein